LVLDMGNKVVLDTSALFSMEDLPAGLEAYVPPGVLNELRRYNDGRAEVLSLKVIVSEPTAASRKKVEEASVRTGDRTRLSPVDKDVLALALDMQAEVLTDDYSVQNLASVLKVPFKAVGLRPIKEVVKWRFVCVGCGKHFDKEQPDCPVCGSQLRTYRGKKR
jgi:UPF0271 protein